MCLASHAQGMDLYDLERLAEREPRSHMDFVAHDDGTHDDAAYAWQSRWYSRPTAASRGGVAVDIGKECVLLPVAQGPMTRAAYADFMRPYLQHARACLVDLLADRAARG